jgi:hypothetical protein
VSAEDQTSARRDSGRQRPLRKIIEVRDLLNGLLVVSIARRPWLGVEDDRDRPVVDELNGHARAEDTRFDGDA